MVVDLTAPPPPPVPRSESGSSTTTAHRQQRGRGSPGVRPRTRGSCPTIPAARGRGSPRPAVESGTLVYPPLHQPRRPAQVVAADARPGGPRLRLPSIDGSRGAPRGLTGRAPPSSTVRQPLLPAFDFERRDCRSGRGLSRRPPPAGAGSVVNRCGGGWSAVADAPSAPRGSQIQSAASVHGTRPVRPRTAPEFVAAGPGPAGELPAARSPGPDPNRSTIRATGVPTRTSFEGERCSRFVEGYNHRRYHEALQNVPPGPRLPWPAGRGSPERQTIQPLGKPISVIAKAQIAARQSAIERKQAEISSWT